MNNAKEISKDEAVDLFLAGRPVVFAEYRSSESETINWRDRESGRAMSAPVLRHTVEFGNKSVTVQERVPDNFDTTHYVPPFKKGQSVLVELASMESQRGAISVRGTLTAIVS